MTTDQAAEADPFGYEGSSDPDDPFSPEASLDPDDPFNPQVEEEEARPQGLDSDHAEHMELLESSKIIPSGAAWLMLALSILFLGATGVFIAALIVAPDFLLQWTVGGIVALSCCIGLGVHPLVVRRRFKRLCEEARFDISREVAQERVTYGDLVDVSLDATGCTWAPAVKVALRDRPAPGFESGRRIILREPGAVQYQARAVMRGEQLFQAVDILMRDRGGLFRHTRSYEVSAGTEVEPGTAALTLRNMFSGRSAFPDGAPKALVNLFRDVEHEQLREYQGGDRMKDVDWKRMSATGQMMVKDRIVESLNVGLLLIDAGTSMRLVEAGKRNLDAALEGASEIIQEAGRRNHQIGFLAFDDEKVIEEMPPTRSRMLYRDALERFQRVASRVDEDHEGEAEPLAVSMQRALRKMAGSQMGVLLFSDLETIDEGIIQALSRLGGDGAKVGVLILPQPTMRAKRLAYRRDGTRPAKGHYRGKGHRTELREVLSVQGIETMDLPI